AMKWNPDRGLIEDKASGQSVIQELKMSSRLAVFPIRVDADKVTRAYAATPLIEAGKVFLPQGAAWLSDFFVEVSSFPNPPQEHRTDALTQALNYLRGQSAGFGHMQEWARALVGAPQNEFDGGEAEDPMAYYEERRRYYDGLDPDTDGCHYCGRQI